jgi:hypothetical protein
MLGGRTSASCAIYGSVIGQSTSPSEMYCGGAPRNPRVAVRDAREASQVMNMADEMITLFTERERADGVAIG